VGCEVLVEKQRETEALLELRAQLSNLLAAVKTRAETD
jgi:hypothetical protein